MVYIWKNWLTFTFVWFETQLRINRVLRFALVDRPGEQKQLIIYYYLKTTWWVRIKTHAF